MTLEENSKLPIAASIALIAHSAIVICMTY